jgi:hypothetical protein
VKFTAGPNHRINSALYNTKTPNNYRRFWSLLSIERVLFLSIYKKQLSILFVIHCRLFSIIYTVLAFLSLSLSLILLFFFSLLCECEIKRANRDYHTRSVNKTWFSLARKFTDMPLCTSESTDDICHSSIINRQFLTCAFVYVSMKRHENLRGIHTTTTTLNSMNESN